MKIGQKKKKTIHDSKEIRLKGESLDTERKELFKKGDASRFLIFCDLFERKKKLNRLINLKKKGIYISKRKNNRNFPIRMKIIFCRNIVINT